MKTLYGVAGQDYCRHHAIRAAVVAGVIAEVKPVPDRWRRLIGECPRPNMASSTSAEPVYAITLHQPGASLTALAARARKANVGAVAGVMMGAVQSVGAGDEQDLSAI